MTEYLPTDTDLKKVADAIRETTGTTDPLSFPDGFVSAIAGVGGGGKSGLSLERHPYLSYKSRH